MDIDEVIDRLLDVMATAGVGPVEAPESYEPLRTLEEALRPLQLPADVRRFWERVDPRTWRINFGGEWYSPADALHYWENYRVFDPLGLLPVILATQEHLLTVELVGGRCLGGTMVDSFGYGELYQVFAPSFRSFLEAVLESVEIAPTVSGDGIRVNADFAELLMRRLDAELDEAYGVLPMRLGFFREPVPTAESSEDWPLT